MPAGRNCAGCGRPLGSDVRWCLVCHRPVREFTPRPKGDVGGFTGTPIHDRPMSRWAASATTFGPLGRLVITGLILAFGIGNLVVLGATPFGIWFLLGFSLLASVVLRSTWHPVPVERDPGDASRRARRPRPPKRVPSWVWPILALAVTIGAGIAWTDLDVVERFFVAAGVIAFGVGVVLARANEL